MAGSSLTIHASAGHAAGLLRTQRAPVESTLETNDADLSAADLDAVRTRELDGTLSCFRASRQKKDLLQPSRKAGETFDELRTLFAGKT
jgi:hypothetical protein